MLEDAQVNDCVADSGAAGGLVGLWVDEDAEGDVLEGEVAGRVDGEPGLESGGLHVRVDFI